MKSDGKPLGMKSYGHIPHFPGSRMGPGDHHCSEGQHRIACEKARDKHDLIIVQEKVDGSNVCVAMKGGELLALTRAGWTAESSPHEQHHLFASWVRQNADRFRAMLGEGERACGEWMALAHGTRYQLPHEPFVLFDLFRQDRRLTVAELEAVAEAGDFTMPRLLHRGAPISIAAVREMIEPEPGVIVSGHGALDPVEGAVWRVERKGELNFIAKWVRADKADGKFLPSFNPEATPYWNWRPEAAAA